MCEGRLAPATSHPTYRTAFGRARRVEPTSPGADDGGLLTETGHGHLAMQRVMRCIPGAQGTRFGGRGNHVVIQVRTGVELRLIGDAGGVAEVRDQVALAAFSEPDDSPLTWVQTGQFVAERIEWFDGRTEERRITYERTYHGETSPSREPARSAGDRVRFKDRGQEWWIDSRSSSARYAHRGIWLPAGGYANGEIVYDSPLQQTAYAQYFSDNPDVKKVYAPIEFRSYLYRRPGSARALAQREPLAMVEWWFTQELGRDSVGGAWRSRGGRPRLLWILMNPVEPLRLDNAIGAYPSL